MGNGLPWSCNQGCESDSTSYQECRQCQHDFCCRSLHQADICAKGPFTVQLHAGLQSNLPLGISARPDSEDPQCLRVENIVNPSLISLWNRQNHKTVQVRVGDLIASVNGVSGSTSSMTDQLITAGLSPDYSELILGIWPKEGRRLHNLQKHGMYLPRLHSHRGKLKHGHHGRDAMSTYSEMAQGNYQGDCSTSVLKDPRVKAERAMRDPRCPIGGDDPGPPIPFVQDPVESSMCPEPMFFRPARKAGRS